MKNYFKTRHPEPISDVASFWDSHYARGGLSGEGSYRNLYEYKRDYLLDFVRQHNIRKIVDLGCGDGNQTREIEVESYVGLDVSQSAIETCQSLYSTPSKEFMLVDQYPGAQADLVISLDVIYHLVIDKLYFQYLEQLNSL
jgi:trans-aconitate methyltransferase